MKGTPTVGMQVRLNDAGIRQIAGLKSWAEVKSAYSMVIVSATPARLGGWEIIVDKMPRVIFNQDHLDELAVPAIAPAKPGPRVIPATRVAPPVTSPEEAMGGLADIIEKQRKRLEKRQELFEEMRKVRIEKENEKRKAAGLPTLEEEEEKAYGAPFMGRGDDDDDEPPSLAVPKGMVDASSLHEAMAPDNDEDEDEGDKPKVVTVDKADGTKTKIASRVKKPASKPALDPARDIPDNPEAGMF